MAADRRNRRAAALAFVAGVAALIGCASTPASNDWQVLEGPALVVYSDGSLEGMREFYSELEHFRAAMRWFTNRKEAPPRSKTRIMLFKSGTDALPYLVTKDIGAWASVTATGNLAVAKLEGKTKDIDRQTLKRDLVKLWLDDDEVRAPTWYREGLAELVSAFTIEGNKVTIGGRPPIELSKFAELIADEKKGHTPGALLGDEVARYDIEDRARVWLVAHYLLIANKERQENLRDYFVAWRTGTPSADAFTKAFGQPPADFFRLEVGRYGTRQLAARQFAMTGEIPEPKLREASSEEIEKLTAEVERAVQRLR